jgi:TPR repeat protein
MRINKMLFLAKFRLVHFKMFEFFKSRGVLLGTGLVASIGAYFLFFNREKPSEKKKEGTKTVKKNDDEFVHEFIELMNLREVGNKAKIIHLTKGKPDLMNLSFYAEAISTDPQLKDESNRILTEISQSKSQDALDLFSIGKCLQLMNKKAEALKVYIKAADKGCQFAYSHIGVYYQHGMGVEPDINEAVRYYKLGVKHRDPLCKYLYALMLFQGDSVEKNETLSLKYLEQTAKAGYIPAMITRGELLMHTKPEETIKLFDELIEKYEFLPAMTKKGLCMMQGIGTKKDLDGALKLITKAAESGDEQAQDIQVSILAEKDPELAFELLKKYVTTRAFATTLYRLGQFYQAGIGTKKNVKNAYKMYETAAEIGSLDALYILGISALEGVKGEDGFEYPKNEDAAQEYLVTAAQAGHPGAMQFLDEMMKFTGQHMQQ